MVTVGCPGPEAALLPCSQASLLHEPANTCFGTVEALSAQHLLNPSATVSATTSQEEHTDLFTELGVLFGPSTCFFVPVSVKTARAHLQRLTEFLHRMAILSTHLFDQFEALEFSCPKMAKAFFKMSRCRLTVSNSRRRCATSAAKSLAGSLAAALP